MRLYFLVFAICACSGQKSPGFVRTEDGHIQLVIPGFQNIARILLTVSGSSFGPSFIVPRVSADGQWRAILPDVTDDDDVLHYVIEYHLPSRVHKQKGSLQINDRKSAVAPVSRRHLERRLTTVFFDDFTSGHIDPSKWKHAIEGDRGGNEEFQLYDPDPVNSYVKNDILYIRPTLTADHFGEDFLFHGDLDLRDWIWPAIWMMPTEDHYGIWPRSGEIDIMESRGNLHYTLNGQSMGADVDNVNIHWGPHWQHKTGTLSGETFADNFHGFWMDWTENYIRLGVDDHTIQAWDTPSQGYWAAGHFSGDDIWFYLLLNVAVGGHFFWEAIHNSPYPQPWHDGQQDMMMQFWKNRHLWEPTWHGEDAAMKIRSVKMEQY
ncbi:hypothetical protein BaRGS_00002999 [Batillaria attramentaria]|uniref:GH16 domain-containing protein n=1 Tax=Batillaria attramentaria TaxID=370345 RepID=A0ABD0M3A3_9CAEN